MTQSVFAEIDLFVSRAIKNPIKLERPAQDCWIYLLLDAGRIVYVGQTIWGIERVLAHRRDKTFDSYCYFVVDRKDATRFEAHCIAKYTPIYNKTIPPNGGFETVQRLKNILRVGGWDIRRKIKRLGIQPIVLGEHKYYRYDEVVRDA